MVPVNHVVILSVLGVAVLTDVKTGKIKNWLTLPAIALGPVVCTLAAGGHGAVLSMQAIGLMALVGMVVFSFRILGGGDLKLLVAVGALGAVPDGLVFVRNTLMFTALAGGVLALVVLMWQRRAAAAASQLARAAWLKMTLRVNCLAGIGRTKIPYSLAIATGTIVAIVWPL